MVDDEAQSKDGVSDIDENLEEPAHSDEELYAILFTYGFMLIHLTVRDLFHWIEMQMPTMTIRRWLTWLTLCPSCILRVRIHYLLIFIKVFLPSRALHIFFYVMFLNTKNSLLSSHLCEVRAFTGSVDSLRTPFKESCENMSKSEIGCVSTSYLL